MRTHALVSVAFFALAACANAQHGSPDNASSPGAPSPTPSPLLSCETREFSLDGADLVVEANVDQTPASITILRAPDDDTREKAFIDARKIFGDPHPDTRTQTRQYKWGMVQLTDMCGRPVMPSAIPSATPSPG